MRLLPLALLATLLSAQVPAQDARNTDIPATRTHFSMPAYHTLAEWQARRIELQRQILAATGLLPMLPKTPLHARIFGRIERGGYSVEKVLLETLPGYYLGGNLYRPHGRTGKFPGIVSPHGHWTKGRLENSERASVPGRCINLARQGYVVFTYDMVGYEDTTQTSHNFAGKAEELWSFTPLGLQTWNSIRATDFVASLPDVDPRKLAATGASGGGTQTFLLTALDSRIRYSAPVNMISAIMQGGDPCENAPGLRVGAFNVEFGAMMAPRPLLMVSDTTDWTRNTLKEEYPEIRKIYELYGKADDVEAVQIVAKHNYNKDSREAVYKFFGKWILGDSNPADFTEKAFQVEKDSDLLALAGRSLPPDALSYPQIFAEWKKIATKQIAGIHDVNQLKSILCEYIGVEWPVKVLHELQGNRIALSRAGRKDHVPGIWIPGHGVPVLVVNPAGSEAAHDQAQVKRLIAARRPVLMIDAFQTGAAVAPRERSKDYFLTFNRSDDANRVQDIVTALAFLNEQQKGRIELIGAGDASIWSYFAAAAARVPVTLHATLGDFKGADQDFTGRFFVPGIQRAGGLETARRILARR